MSRTYGAGSEEMAGLWRQRLDFLRNPASYADGSTQVDCVETHMSWVFLTARYAYKLKKPVTFGFVDFSSLDSRYAACREEIRLNQRLAPDVYLGLTPLTIDRQGQRHLGGAVMVEEWLVRMRRLPADRCLTRLIADKKLAPRDVESLAERLWQFYRGLPPVSCRADEYRQAILRHVEDNRRELVDRAFLPEGRVNRIVALQRRLLVLHPQLFDVRVCDGRIIEGHGDLRPEHVYFAPKPVVIDALEFSRELRVLDVVDELCFFAMECAVADAADVGYEVLERYQRASQDRPPTELLAFYETYRALVRAKVAVLRSLQQPWESPATDACRVSALRYVAWADRRLSGLMRPLLLVVMGGSGTGKSTLAGELERELAAYRLGTDALRRFELFQGDSGNGFDRGRYAPAERARVYQHLRESAIAALSQRATVVVDGTFGDAEERQSIYQAARRVDADVVFIECRCPLELARERVAKRRSTHESEIRPEQLEQQARKRAPLSDELPTIVVDTSTDVATALSETIVALQSFVMNPGTRTSSTVTS